VRRRRLLSGQLRSQEVLAGLLDRALPVLEVGAAAVLVAGINADQVHLGAIAVADQGVAVEARDREDFCG
jgi:hypothetical protein